MSSKQSKIYSFFQRKPSLSGDSSPSISKTNPLKENDESVANNLPKASGDSCFSIKQEVVSPPGNFDLSMKRRRFNDDKLTKDGNEIKSLKQEESWSPKLKRKRIVSITINGEVKKLMK